MMVIVVINLVVVDVVIVGEIFVVWIVDGIVVVFCGVML